VRAPGLLVDLRYATLHARGADVAPAVGLEGRAQCDGQAARLEPPPVDEARRLDRRRLDDRRLVRQIREAPRDGNVFELAPYGPSGRRGARLEEQEGEQRDDESLDFHGRDRKSVV